jgi:hypothetical protein
MELNLDVVAPLPADGQVLGASASRVLLDDAGGLASAEFSIWPTAQGRGAAAWAG